MNDLPKPIAELVDELVAMPGAVAERPDRYAWGSG